MSTLVMKFGGTVLGTVAALTQVLSIILHEYKRWDRLLLVASALDGVTDMLLEATQLAHLHNQRGYRRIAATLRTRHLALVEHLPLETHEQAALQADIDRLLFEMLDECQTLANSHAETLPLEMSDRIVAVGEKLSSRIIAALLRHHGLRGVAVDAGDILVTDNNFGLAYPMMEVTRRRVDQHLLPMLERRIVPVVTGFIGATEDGQTTTIGRGGSDLTASILGVCSDAHEVWVWSNVDGMMSSDPQEVENTRIIEELSYTEVAELAYFGARILHARMIRPLQDHRIPLRVKNVYKPQQPGTLIRHGDHTTKRSIKAVTSIHSIGLSANRSGSLNNIVEFIQATLFEHTGNHADVMITSQSSNHSFLCFVIPNFAGGPEADATIRTLIEQNLVHLQDTVPWHLQPLTTVTIIGDALDYASPIAAQLLAQLNGLRVVGLAQGPAGCSLSLIFNPDEAEEALQRIHAMMLNND